MLLGSVPAELGFRAPKRVEQGCKFAGDRNARAFWPFALGQLVAPDLQRAGAFESGEDGVCCFIQGVAQHRIACFGDMPFEVALTRLIAPRGEPAIGSDIAG